jgi:hypothetical protein
VSAGHAAEWWALLGGAVPAIAGGAFLLGVVLLLLGWAAAAGRRLLVAAALALGLDWLVRRDRSFYATYLRCAGWRRKRRGALRRARHRCARCHTAGPLDVHHLTYDRLGDEAPGDLTALCRACHSYVHARRPS